MTDEGTVTILLDRQKASVKRVENETLLDSARRAGLSPPFSCEAGNCGTCMAKIVDGKATMRVNDALDDDEVAEGYILTCQGVPDTESVTVGDDWLTLLCSSRPRARADAAPVGTRAHTPRCVSGCPPTGTRPPS